MIYEVIIYYNLIFPSNSHTTLVYVFIHVYSLMSLTRETEHVQGILWLKILWQERSGFLNIHYQLCLIFS